MTLTTTMPSSQPPPHPQQQPDRRPGLPKNRWLARALLSVALFASSAQAACVSLATSKACPSYSAFFVDTSVAKTVSAFYITMPSFTTPDDFDNAVFNATGFQTSSDCTGYNSSVRIPYQNTVLCTIAVLDDQSAKCKGTPTNISANLCDSSCVLYQNGLESMIDSRCPKAPTALSQLKDVKTICSRSNPGSWGGLQDTSATCINSLVNEAAFCGLASRAEMCTYCKTNTTQSCCQDAQTVCPTTTTAGPTSTNLGAPPSVSPTDSAVPPSSSKTGLSSGTLGAIIGGSIAGVLLIAFVLLLCFRRARQNESKGSNNLARQMSSSSGRYNISSPKLQEEGGYVAATPIPMTTLPPISTDPSSFGLSGVAAGAGAGMAAGAALGASGALAGREATAKQSYCQALYPYQASMADELDLTPGDIVNVQRVFDDGWAVGVNMNTSNEGAFPVVCVMFVDESALDDDFEDVNMHSMAPMTLREEDEQGRRSPSVGGRNSPRSSLPSRSSSPVHLPRRNSSIRDSTVIVPGSSPMTSSPLAGHGNPYGGPAGAGQGQGQGRLTPPVMRDTMLSDASSINRWWEGEK